MSLKQSINSKLRIVEPVFDVANSRAEYRLPADMMFFSDFRLVNVGSTTTNASLYNAVLGAEAHIKAIRLFDGATELSAVNDFPQWRSYQKLMVSNDGASDVGAILSRNSLGFIGHGAENIINASYNETPDVQSANVATLSDFGQVGQKAWISLKSIFPFLQSIPVMPTSLFRQLRVEIEYNSAANMAELLIAPGITTLSSSRALLLADEIQDPEQEASIMKKLIESPIRFKGLVQDQFQLNAVAAPASGAVSHSQTQRLRGFDGSYVHELIVKVVPQTVPLVPGGTDQNPFGAVGSKSLYNPQLQVAVNGQNIIPRDGLRGKMRALAMTTDSMGSLDLPVSCARLPQQNPGNGYAGVPLNGRSQYLPYAIDIEQYVEDMQLTIQRDAVSANADLIASYNIVCFGLIDRALVFEQGAGMVGGDSRYKIINLSN